MIKPDEKVVRTIAAVAQQYPEFTTWVELWRQHELEQLPNAVNNPALSQGRCQVLSELYRFVKDAPAVAAKL